MRADSEPNPAARAHGDVTNPPLTENLAGPAVLSLRCTIRDTARRAAAELIQAAASESVVSFASLAGLPTPTEGAQLATEMRQAL